MNSAARPALPDARLRLPKPGRTFPEGIRRMCVSGESRGRRGACPVIFAAVEAAEKTLTLCPLPWPAAPAPVLRIGRRALRLWFAVATDGASEMTVANEVGKRTAAGGGGASNGNAKKQADEPGVSQGGPRSDGATERQRLRMMMLIRRFEEKTFAEYTRPGQKIGGFCHLYS